MYTEINTEEMVNNSNQPQQTKKIRKHIEDYEYFITMGRYVDGKLSQKEITELEDDIKTVQKLLNPNDFVLPGRWVIPRRG